MVTRKLFSSFFKEIGQELIEYAITLPIFLIIVLGIFDLGRAVFFYSAMQNAAREGARFGVVNPRDTVNVINRVKERSLGLVADDIGVSVAWTCELVTVDVEFEFNPITPFVGGLFPPDGDANISTRSELQRERWDAEPPDGDDVGCTPWVD